MQKVLSALHGKLKSYAEFKAKTQKIGVHRVAKEQKDKWRNLDRSYCSIDTF